jgi:hypothetical protein
VAVRWGLWEKVSKVFSRGGIFRDGVQRDGATGRIHGRVLGNLLISDKDFIRVTGGKGMRRRRSGWIESVLNRSTGYRAVRRSTAVGNRVGNQTFVAGPTGMCVRPTLLVAGVHK